MLCIVALWQFVQTVVMQDLQNFPHWTSLSLRHVEVRLMWYQNVRLYQLLLCLLTQSDHEMHTKSQRKLLKAEAGISLPCLLIQCC